MYRNRNNTGFTIVELMFAMLFVSLLLLAIAATVMQMSVIYNRGITLKEVNQSGRNLLDVLTRDIAAATPFDVDTASATSSMVVGDGGGRLCLGQYTYAWTPSGILNGSDTLTTPFTTYNGEHVRFARISDAGGGLCAGTNRTTARNITTASDPNIEVNDILGDGARDLIVHTFTIEQTAASPISALYSLTIRLGVNDADLITTAGACRPPGGTEGSGDDLTSSYCAINEFNTVVRAGNRE